MSDVSTLCQFIEIYVHNGMKTFLFEHLYFQSEFSHDLENNRFAITQKSNNYLEKTQAENNALLVETLL